MRKHLVWVMGLAAVVALASVGTAAAFTTTQHINGKVTPTKRPKATRVPATLFVDVFATTDNPNGIPSPAKLGKVDFDKDGALLQKDKLVVHQRLDPLEEKSIASPDFKERPNATRGTLTVLDARQVK